MSSDYSPPSPSASHEARHLSHGGTATDANIRNFAPVARIMKTALPDNAKIAKEAKECMQECVSEFISFITSEGQCFFPLPRRVRGSRLTSTRPRPKDMLTSGPASEKCQQEKRK